MIKEEREVFISYDGKEFKSEEECVKHEKETYIKISNQNLTLKAIIEWMDVPKHVKGCNKNQKNCPFCELKQLVAELEETGCIISLWDLMRKDSAKITG